MSHKQIFYSLIVSALVFASCSKEELDEPQAVGEPNAVISDKVDASVDGVNSSEFFEPTVTDPGQGAHQPGAINDDGDDEDEGKNPD